MTVKIVFEDSKGRIRPLDNILAVDAMTRALAGVSYVHHKIHDGNSFATDFADATLADAATIIMVFKTMKGTRRVHLLMEFSTLVGGYIEIWEGPIWTTNTGTVNPITNRLRKSGTRVSGLLEDKTSTPVFTATGNVLVNPTGLNTGGATSLHKHYAWGERGKVGAIGQRDENEFVLKPDTQYAVVFTGIGASNKAQLILNWYEHTDSD